MIAAVFVAMNEEKRLFFKLFNCVKGRLHSMSSEDVYSYNR